MQTQAWKKGERNTGRGGVWEEGRGERQPQRGKGEEEEVGTGLGAEPPHGPQGRAHGEAGCLFLYQ